MKVQGQQSLLVFIRCQLQALHAELQDEMQVMRAFDSKLNSVLHVSPASSCRQHAAAEACGQHAAVDISPLFSEVWSVAPFAAATSNGHLPLEVALRRAEEHAEELCYLCRQAQNLSEVKLM